MRLLLAPTPLRGDLRRGRRCLQGKQNPRHPESHSFRGHLPTAHTLVCLRFAGLVAETVARLTTGSGGLTPGRAGFAPAGRRTKFHGVIAVLQSQSTSRAWSHRSSYAPLARNGKWPGNSGLADPVEFDHAIQNCASASLLADVPPNPRRCTMRKARSFAAAVGLLAAFALCGEADAARNRDKSNVIWSSLTYFVLSDVLKTRILFPTLRLRAASIQPRRRRPHEFPSGSPFLPPTQAQRSPKPCASERTGARFRSGRSTRSREAQRYPL